MNPEKDDTHRRNIDGSYGAVDSRGLAALTDSLSTICIDTTTTFISSIHVEVRLKKGVYVLLTFILIFIKLFSKSLTKKKKSFF